MVIHNGDDYDSILIESKLRKINHFNVLFSMNNSYNKKIIIYVICSAMKGSKNNKKLPWEINVISG